MQRNNQAYTVEKILVNTILWRPVLLACACTCVDAGTVHQSVYGFKSPGGYLCETGILLLALYRYIGDPDVIDHCGVVWGGPRPEASLGPRAHNVIIPLDLTQLSCPGFTLAAGLPSGFTTDGVGCWGGALWRARNLTSFSPCLTGPVDYPFASCHKGPGVEVLYGQGVVYAGYTKLYTTVYRQ
jgi:hypothetical protein